MRKCILFWKCDEIENNFWDFVYSYIAYVQSPGLLFSLSWNIHRIFLRLCTDSETYCLLCQFFVINYYYKNIASLTLLYWNFFLHSFSKKHAEVLWPGNTMARNNFSPIHFGPGKNFQLQQYFELGNQVSPENVA